jgi:hypothetical protein
MKHGVAKWKTSSGNVRYELWSNDVVVKEISEKEFL